MEPGAPSIRREWQKTVSVAIVLAVICGSAGIASASGGGGVGTPDPPTLTGVICLERCADIREATVGSRVQLSGRDLDGISEVRFAAAGGGRVAATPTAVTSTAVAVKVPDGAATGTVRARAYGVEAETPSNKPLKIVAADQIPDAGQFKLTSAEAVPHQTFYDGQRAPQVSYIFQGKGATDIRIEVVDRQSKQVVDTWIQQDAEPSTRNTAKWNGLTSDGAQAPGADYKFRIGSAAGGGTVATEDSGFAFHYYRFPLDAHHTYGDGYGAGRGHEGQDVFAKCGTPIHAARGGHVQAIDVQSAAGNYVVIDSRGTAVDTFYAHLIHRSPLREGARVKTGQVIGNVGQTGNASGCHLHFEIWTAPGWYEGGHAMPSVGQLMHTWDAWS
jgi:murein DD-endopeptidase MepM/ murein hydrolase activator NlpD